MIKILVFISIVPLLFAQDYEKNTSTGVVKEKRFAGRQFIKNTLVEVFGESSSSLIDEVYFKVGKQVGGPCDIYEQVYYEHDKVLNPSVECPGGKPASKNSLFPKTNILRSSHILKTCYEISINKDLPKKFQGKDYLKKISNSFYPFGGDEKLKKKLSKKSQNKGEEAIKKTLLTYCLSPGWQTL